VFCGQNDSMQRIVIEMFRVCNGECLLLKAVHNWVEKRSRNLSGDEEVETEVSK
jgi:hypothetical protein